MRTRTILLFAAAAAVTAITPSTLRAEVSRKDVVIIDATKFLAQLPSHDGVGVANRAGRGGRGAGRRGGGRGGRGASLMESTTAPAPARAPAPPAAQSTAPQSPAPWSFENYAITLREDAPVSATVTIPDAATYTLFVRSRGAADSSFKVSINGQASSETFGNAPESFKSGGTFTLQPGPATITLTDIHPGASTDVIVLSKNPALTEDDLKPLQYPEDVVLLKDYHIIRADGVKFGDLNGDGKMDVVALTPNYSTYAYDNDGHELWHFENPEEGTVQRSQFEAPGVVWDFDHRGKADVASYRIVDGKELLVIADGMTGEIRHQTPWPTKPQPHVYNNFRLAVARLHPGYPDDLICYSDSGGLVYINAYGPDLQLLWSYSRERLKDYYGHYIYPVDLHHTGVDDIYLAQVLLGPDGKEIWNNYDLFPDNHDHIDSARFVDLNGDGKLELVTGQSDVGTVLYEADTGKLLWQRFSNHTQKIEAGNYLASGPQPQIVANSRYYTDATGMRTLGAQVRYFDTAGHRLDVWPSIAIAGNPNFVKGDFKGDGHIELFWLRFHLEPDGTGAMYFPDQVFHMFDFMGTGNDQVVTLSTDEVRIYGYKNAQTHPAKRDPDYLYKSVANHTHY
ncbi:MAG TPA: hypothetical protein VHQ47_04590 [Phycisphaerae bacterium]|nr:hypothetical protein [Phycisphaerae bacterium]